MIEVVTNAQTISKIQKENEGSVAGAMKDSVLYDWLSTHNTTDRDQESAVENFTVSCAGYCVATYVLGIGDRHNDNIMLKKDGHFFHIDFGHFLGNFKTFMGISRERAPFVFTPDMAFVIMRGRKDRSPRRVTNVSQESQERTSFSTPNFGINKAASVPLPKISTPQKENSLLQKETSRLAYNRFLETCTKAHSILRDHGDLFINLLTLMLSSGMPELEAKKDIWYVVETLSSDNFQDILNQTGGQLSTRFNFIIHNIVH